MFEVSVLIKRLLFLSVVALLGCATGYAPVSDLTIYSSRTSEQKKYLSTNLPPKYTVVSGDTLYSIAWKYGLDFKQLAIKNRIPSNYLINPGQVLLIADVTNNKIIKRDKHKINKTDSVSVKRIDKNKIPVSNKPIVVAKTKSTSAQKPQNNTLDKSVKPASLNIRKVIWNWPVKTRKFQKFNNENKGLDFTGEQGQSVYAAASGKVVYAGNGIIGYGNLIIIKHTEEYLSAYAHNSVILVKDSNYIKAGEKVAEIGNSGTIKTILHFEIRKDGKPVNPLLYLPKN